MANKDDQKAAEHTISADDFDAPDAVAETEQDKLPETGDTYELPEDDEAVEPEAEQQLGDGDAVMADDEPPKTPGKFKRFFIGYWRKKKWTMPLTLLVIVGAVFAIPATRYPLLALGFKQTYTLEVVDSKTNTPVSGARVTLDGQTETTNNNGDVVVKAKVGSRAVVVSKQYYQTATMTVFVGISAGKNVMDVHLVATGRQVPVSVVNKITGKPIADAEITVLDTEAKTDASGVATIVLPTGTPTQSATVSATGYNNLASNITVTSSVVSSNTFALTPTGRVYFLSNLSGNIDVVSTHLDGSSRKTVLAGTGNEDPNNTALLAARDWQYLALLSKRDNGQYAKLYLINTSNDQMTTIDGNSGSEYINPIGWVDHNFVYQLTTSTVPAWQNGQTVLKSFDAESGKTVTIDQTSADGMQASYEYQTVSFVNLIDNKVVYGLSWNSYSGVINPAQHDAIMSADIDGSNKVTLKNITIPNQTWNTYMASFLPKPGSLDIQTSVGSNQPNVYYTYNYSNNTVTQSNTISDASFLQEQQNYVTYLASPSGSQAFWAEQRDGKYTLFVGDSNGGNSNQIANLSDYTTYGWFSDNYLLVEKGGSELYILPVGGGQALKVSDYYKPPRSFYGYGGGYGGL